MLIPLSSGNCAAIATTSAALSPQQSVSTQQVALNQAIDDAARRVHGEVSAPRMAAALGQLREELSLRHEGQTVIDIEMQVQQVISGQANAMGGEMQGLSVDPALNGIDRTTALLNACYEALSGPASNVLAATARTGLIVAMAVTLRETLTYYIELGLQASDPSEATRAWTTAGVFLIGPALNLLGMVREEVQGSANFNTRVGRACMLALNLGTGLALTLQGGLAGMLPNTVGTTVYSMIRDSANTLVRLGSNVADYNLVPNAGAAALNGVISGLMEGLAGVLPTAGTTGASGAAQGLGYNVFATLLNAMPTVVGAVIDDLSLSWANVRGNPETASEPLQLSVSVQRASLTDLVTMLTTGCALRTSAIHAINFAVTSVLIAYADPSREGTDYSAVLGASVVGAMASMIYLPFVHGTLSTPPGEPTSTGAGALPERYTQLEFD